MRWREICRRLDGIPLAIELAAARVVSMSPSEIRGLLDERFRLLTGGRRTAVERHQTLRATVDWSYSLLGERERAVFDRLGVFAGSFDAPAAQAVVVGDGVEAWDVLDALTELVAKSMIVAEETADGTTRYQMLETLRQYARERLDEHGDTDRWRRRHAEYFADWAEEAGPGLVGRDELAWRTRENAELDNLRAAVTWALDRDEPDDIRLALRIIGALAYESRIDPAAGIGAWAERALPHVEITTPPLRYAVTAAAASSPNPPRELRTRPGTRRASDRRWRAPRRARTPVGLLDARGSVRRCAGMRNKLLRSCSTQPDCSTATSPTPRTAKSFMRTQPCSQHSRAIRSPRAGSRGRAPPRTRSPPTRPPSPPR